MINYKGFLIQMLSGMSEDRNYDRHRWENAGTYSSWVDYQIIDPEAAKTLSGFDTEEKAKEYIDNYLAPEVLPIIEERMAALTQVRDLIGIKTEEIKHLLETETRILSELPRKNWY